MRRNNSSAAHLDAGLKSKSSSNSTLSIQSTVEKKRSGRRTSAELVGPRVDSSVKNSRPRNRKQSVEGSGKQLFPLSVKDNSEYEITEKINSKRKRKPTNNKITEGKKSLPRVIKKSTPYLDSFLSLFGIKPDDIILTNTQSLEAVRVLNLQQWHLRKLKKKFEEIDVDESGAIDKEEFMVSYCNILCCDVLWFAVVYCTVHYSHCSVVYCIVL